MSGLDEKGLLPCPFCGGEAVLEMAIPCHSGAWVQCVECDAQSSAFAGKDADDSDAIAIAAWNRRASAPPAPDGLEPVAWRWKAKDAVLWIYNPAPEWLRRQSDDEIDREPLYSAATLSAQEAEIERLRKEQQAKDAVYWATAEQCANLETDLARLRKVVERAKEVVEPFADFGVNNTDADGWGGTRCEGERIRDWFGPSEFRAARQFAEEVK